MSKQLTQEERLDCLVEGFKADSEEYKDLEYASGTRGFMGFLGQKYLY